MVEAGPIADDELLLASLVGDRDDFVIDLRDGQKVRSYLRMEPREVDGRFDHLPGSRMGLRVVRRMLDVLSASAALLLAAPLMVGVAVAIKLESRGPMFFRQERVGRNGKIFTCLKFRSMHVDADERLKDLLSEGGQFREEWLRDQKASNDPRITRVGRFVRKTSLDELPQFLNVLRGDMSFIGPRPVLPAETLRYGDDILEVLTVRPGITGLWQVSGRNSLTYEKRVALDLTYVRTQSLPLDALVMVKTLGGVITQDGAS